MLEVTHTKYVGFVHWWGYICNSVIDILHELEKQITLFHNQAFYMWALAEIPHIFFYIILKVKVFPHEYF